MLRTCLRSRCNRRFSFASPGLRDDHVDWYACRRMGERKKVSLEHEFLCQLDSLFEAGSNQRPDQLQCRLVRDIDGHVYVGRHARPAIGHDCLRTEYLPAPAARAHDAVERGKDLNDRGT